MTTKYKEVLDSKNDAPNCVKGSAMDEINLAKITSKVINFADTDTVLGMHQQMVNKQVNNVSTKIMQKEREEFEKKPKDG